MQHQVEIDGTIIQYWEYHPEQIKTIIFFHGFRGSHRGLVEVAEMLTEYRLILPDLPGWGESETLTATHSFTNYISCLQKFIASFKLERYILAGHSFGASLALIYASQQPTGIEQVLLITPVVNARSFTSRLGELYYAIGAKLPKPFREKWITSAGLNRVTTELMTVTNDPVRRRQIARDEQTNVPYIKDWVEIETFQSFYEVDFWSAMKVLTMPITLIFATNDRMTPMATNNRIAGAMADSKNIVLQGAGHFVPMEDPNELVKAIQYGLTT